MVQAIVTRNRGHAPAITSSKGTRGIPVTSVKLQLLCDSIEIPEDVVGLVDKEWQSVDE
jgi:hypothetical protein